MADYNIFREQLAIKYPSYGHALWGPSPRYSDRPVQVGDVGFIRRGKFHRLFNALLPADDPSHERGVPEYHEPLVPTLLDHLDVDSLGRNDYCSTGVSVEPDPGYHSGPDDFPQVSFQHNRTRGAAVLSLPVPARREDTLARGDFKQWIVRHIDNWFAFARKLGLGIEQMEEIILVTGCDRTRSWTNVAFLGNQADAQVSFGVKVEGPDTSINFQFLRGNARGAVLRHGPEGTNLPENQCVFIRGFRAARSFWILPRRLKAAAGSSPDPGGYECDSDTEVISIPTATKYRDPLHLLLEYIAEQVSDCDMVVAHDDDLVIIDGLGHDASLETLEPDVMNDLFRRSNIEIEKVLCDLSPTDGGPNTDTSGVKVAMISTKPQNWNMKPQWSPIPGSLPLPTIRGDKSKRDTSQLVDDGGSVPSTLQDLTDNTLRIFGPATEGILLALGRIRVLPSNVWPSLNFAHLERDRLLTVIVVKCCAVSLFGWVFSFTWGVLFKLFFTLLLASFPLSVWLEREYAYRRRLDNVYERVEALQHHIASLQLNPALPTVVGDMGILPIMAKTTPANLGTLKSSLQAVVQPAIPGPSSHGGFLVEASASPYNVQSQENASDTMERSTISLIDDTFEQRMRKPSLNTLSVDTLPINALLSRPSTPSSLTSEPFRPEHFTHGPFASSSSLSIFSFVRSPPIFSSTLSLPLYTPLPPLLPPADVQKKYETTMPVQPPAPSTNVRRKTGSRNFFKRVKSALTPRQPSLAPSNATTPPPPAVPSPLTSSSATFRP